MRRWPGAGWETFANAHLEAERVVITDRTWTDPTSSASHLLFGDPVRSVAALVGELASGTPTVDPAWAAAFAQASAVAASALDDLVGGSDDLTEGRCARVLVEALPDGSGLMIGNTLPIRTIDAFGGRRDVDVAVFSQRGANGIDGLVAGSCGSARALERPFTLYIGDVSLLHDLSSLILARDMPRPFVVVVVQNRGGRIFEQLPLGTAPAGADPHLEALFKGTLAHACTPHAIEFSHAAALYGHRFARATTVTELRQALGDAYQKNGCTIIEAVVPDSGAVAEYRALWRAVDAQLAR